MGAPIVGILGSRLSAEVQRTRAELRRRGARVMLADLSGFPDVHQSKITLDSLEVGETDLLEAPVWLLRQLEFPRRLGPGLSGAEETALRDDPKEAEICDRECRSFLESLVWSLSDVARLVSLPEAAMIHARKPLLTARLGRAGVPVPESLTTTDAMAARAFIAAHAGRVVCKAAAGGGETTLALVGAEASAITGPMLFQRRIIGTSLRAYVVGDQVVSCSEVIHGDVVDWRTDQRGARPHPVDTELETILRTTLEVAGLDYAGVDVELDDAGAPYVLDVNPAPLFASYEKASGADVAGALAELLLRLAEEAGR